MANRRLLCPIYCGAVLIAGSVLFAQSVHPVPQAAPERQVTVPPAKDPLATLPFALGNASGAGVRIFPAAEVTPSDKDLLARVEPTLQRRAREMGLGYATGTWSYVQLACPSFPDHLLLRFTQNNGKRDVSMFSVSIPRGSEGRLRVIPILRRSYELFSSVPDNPITVATFNRILDEEKSTDKPEWVNIAQCYAALAGVDPELQSAAALATLDLTEDSAVSIQFVTARPRLRHWTMVFDRRGRLIEARSTLNPAIVLKERRVNAAGMPHVEQVPAKTAFSQHVVQ